MPDRKEVWVLGNMSTDADKTFQWDEDIPNITDADVVILDLSTLYQLEGSKRQTSFGMPPYRSFSKTIAINQRIDQLRMSVTMYLEDKILGGGHIVCLLHYDNVLKRIHDLMNMIPFGIRMVEVAERTKINHANHPLKEYLERVQSVNYDLKVPEILFADIPSNVRLRRKNNSLITDKLEKMIGATFDVLQNGTPRGQLTLLPSLPSTSSEMIDILVSELRGHASPPPLWVNNLVITGVHEIEGKIVDLESKKTEIEKKMSELKTEKRKLNSHSKLLYDTGKPLEKAVKTAFSKLGFTEVAQKREKNKEDWRIDFKSVPDVSFGTIEVKGVKKRTGIRDIDQCDKWVTDYRLKDPTIKAKGIFIPNQYRLSEFPKSKEERKHFEPNELEFAKTRKICIIPSYVLFESLNKVLTGQSPDRSKIEQLIFNTNGVLKSIL